MIKLLFFLSLIVTTVADAKIFLSISGANVRKGKMALGELHPLPGFPAENPTIARGLYQDLQWALEFANLFDYVDRATFATLDRSEDLYQMDYDSFALSGASFALKLGYKITGQDLLLEALLYDVAGKEKIFGTRYQHPMKDPSKIVHALIEDILKGVTGEKGLFQSRILMVCVSNSVRGAQNKEVYVSDPDGGNLKALTQDRRLTLSPAWTAVKNTISYTQYQPRPIVRAPSKSLASSRRPNNAKTAFQTTPVLKTHNLSTGERSIVSERSGMNSGAAWSPKGDRLAMTLSFSGRPEIYLLPISGSGDPAPMSRNLKIQRVAGGGFQPKYDSLLFDVEPSWAPTGNELVFSSARSGQPMIYVANLETMIGRQLTFAGQYNSSPAWSPSGEKIIFAAQRIGLGNFDLYSIDPDGNNLSRLTVGGRVGKRSLNNENPTWAPTGRHFAYSSNEDGKYAIFIRTLDGTVSKKISPPNMECTNPAWGPFEG